MKKFIYLLLLLFAFTAKSQNLLVSEDFEGSTYFPTSGTSINKIRSYENCNPSDAFPNGYIDHGTAYDWTLMRTDYAFEGARSIQFEIHKDQPLVGGSQRIRSEVVIISGKEDSRWTPDVWYGYAVYFPSIGQEADANCSELMTQWWEDGGNDNGVRIQNSKCFFEGTQPSGMALPLYDLFKATASTAPVAIGTGTTSLSNMAPIVKDKWVQFVFHFVHSFGSDGLIEIWRDGIKIYEIKGCNMHAGIPKFKIGLYKASFVEKSSRTSRKIYFDNVRVGKQGSTLADMMSTAPVDTIPIPPPPVIKTAIKSFTLINASTDKSYATIIENGIYSLSKIGSSRLSIRANADSTTSVKFELSGSQTLTYTDKIAPFSIQGDSGGGNYYYGSFRPVAGGKYTLKATPYKGTIAGTAATIHFSIIK